MFLLALTRRYLLPAIVVLLAMMGSIAPWRAAHAAEDEVLLTIKDHRFEPKELKVPAGKRIKLIVHNQDATPEEFESHALNREKVVPAGAKVVIFIGPLKAGRYEFYGEYNPTSAKGVVVVD